MDYYPAIKKNESMAFAAEWKDLQLVILSEVSQKEKDTYITLHSYVESKMRPGGTYLQSRNRLTDVEKRLVVAEEKAVGEEKD